MGSGKFLRRAIKKYGQDAFVKEILDIFSSEREMNLAEKILVVIDREVSYNLCPGGQGGFGFINDHLTEKTIEARRKNGRKTRLLLCKRHQDRLKIDLEYRKKFCTAISSSIEQNNTWIGRKHKPKTIELMKEKAKGRGLGTKNSQFGMMWITNGLDNTRIKKNEELPLGWRRGRIIK